MIKIENTEVVGWKAAVRGMRNPMNSWDKSDSVWEFESAKCHGDCGNCIDVKNCNRIGTNDLDLMNRLSKAGTDHSKFMRMINVYADIVAPRYWWTEFDTYKVGTVRNSCSTMHKIQSKEFTLDDFSHEHLDSESLGIMEKIISNLNDCRRIYNNRGDWVFDDVNPYIKKYWWQMIQLLPQSYNQRATVMLNYQTLKNIYHSRKNHKLDEWIVFCTWIEKLPFSEILTEN